MAQYVFQGLVFPGVANVTDSGEVVIHLLANVKQATIKPLIVETVAAGTLVYTDEYTMKHILSHSYFLLD